MSITKNNHLLLNYIRGLNKVLEDEWQSNAKELGLTLAELHVTWIVHTESLISVSDIAVIGLWDRSTVMQMIKRLQDKGLIKVTKSEEDLRVTLTALTEEGSIKREQSQQKDFELFKFFDHYEKEHTGFMNQFFKFYREANRHFHGDEFVDWVEETTVYNEK